MFPYDWRYGVTGEYASGKTNADLVKEKIDEVLQQTGADKVDVVAHSLGGLIVKEYAMDNPTDNHIGKAVFVGVPNTGAPKAVKALLQGDNFNIHFELFGQTFGLSEAEIKKISENMPASYDLLPSQQYYNEKGSYVEVVNVQSPYTIISDNNLNYGESKSFLIQDYSLNSLAMANAEALHTQNFDNYDLRTAGIDVYAINGCKAGTLGKIVEMRTKNVYGPDTVTYSTPKETPGDGTVPLESATNLPINQNNKYYALVSDHGKMPSQNGIKQEIVNLISGSNLNVGSDLITQDINQCQLNGKGFSVFSPIDIFITDQFGNQLGFADDGSVMNEIPNADFEVWGEPANSADRHKFVYLPTDEGQTYNISLQGTDTGTYTIKVDDIHNNQVIGGEVFESLPVTSDLTGAINLSSALGQTTLTAKEDKESQPETIYPTKILTEEEAEDYLPPMAVITMRTSKEQCKKGGWKNFGTTFKNQGDCVSFVETKDKDKKKK